MFFSKATKQKERTTDMGRKQGSTHERKGKHLSQEERIQIEVLLKHDISTADIAKHLGRDVRTIQREIRRGSVNHLRSDLSVTVVYSSDRAQDDYDLNATAKGPRLKLGNDYEAAEFIRFQIVEEGYAPDVVTHKMKKGRMQTTVCAKTIYSYIEEGLIEGVSNETLPEKSRRGKRRHKALQRNPRKGGARRRSIDERPAEVDLREEFGDWEIDLVVGGKDAEKPVLMTLVERKTRKLIVRKLPDRTQASVLRALNGIERMMGAEAFRVTFKSITADNGSEFLDVEALEQSVFSKKKRTCFYYAHPYASWERGTNENINRMIRRFIAKGRDISKISRSLIRWIENWINNYPRKILEFKSAEEMFILEMAAG